MSSQLLYRKFDMTADLIQFARQPSPRFAFHVINQIHYAGGRVGRPDVQSLFCCPTDCFYGPYMLWN